MSKPVDTVNPVDVLTVTAVEQWQSLFQRIRDPLVAAVLVETLDSDSSLKKQFAPAYALARLLTSRLTRDALFFDVQSGNTRIPERAELQIHLVNAPHDFWLVPLVIE